MGHADYGEADRDNLSAISALRGLVSAYIYDGFESITQMTPHPDSSATFYKIARASMRTEQTDMRGVVSDYAYDQVAVQKIIGRQTA